MKTSFIMSIRISLIALFTIFISIPQSSAQYIKDSMKEFTKIHVAVVPFPRIAIENAINSYEFIGNIERSLLGIGANVTDANKSSALALVDLEIKPVTSGYVYFVRIRFLRKVVKGPKTKDLIPATIWERKAIGFSRKINIKKELLESFHSILDDFISDYSEAHN